MGRTGRRGTRPHVLRGTLALLLLTLLACSGSGAPRPPASADPDFAGTWVDGANELKVWGLDAERLQVEFSGAHEYQSPAGEMVNVGTAEGIATIVDGTAVFQPHGADRSCVITLQRSGERLQVTEEGECGFGLNVTAAGIYRRTSAERPEFGLP